MPKFGPVQIKMFRPKEEPGIKAFRLVEIDMRLRKSKNPASSRTKFDFPNYSHPVYSLSNDKKDQSIQSKRKRSKFISKNLFQKNWPKMAKFCSGFFFCFCKKSTYSDLPNNCAANLIYFLGKKHLHNLIRTYTFINF